MATMEQVPTLSTPEVQEEPRESTIEDELSERALWLVAENDPNIVLSID